MKYKDFEDYIQTKHAEQYHGLDDEMPDDYNTWLEDLSIEDWLVYGNNFAHKYALENMEDMAKKIIDSIAYKPKV